MFESLSLSPFGEQVEDVRTPGIKAQLNDSPFHEMPTWSKFGATESPGPWSEATNDHLLTVQNTENTELRLAIFFWALKVQWHVQLQVHEDGTVDCSWMLLLAPQWTWSYCRRNSWHESIQLSSLKVWMIQSMPLSEGSELLDNEGREQTQWDLGSHWAPQRLVTQSNATNGWETRSWRTQIHAYGLDGQPMHTLSRSAVQWHTITW